MKVAVVSSVYGDFDFIKSVVPQTIDADWIFVTDRPDVSRAPWRVIVEPRSPRTEPRLASRVAKCDPWLYTDADVVIWVDGNIQITSPTFVEMCLDSLGDSPICQHRDFYGHNVYDEMRQSFNVGGWGHLSLADQAEYLERGETPPPEIWKSKWGDDPIREQIEYYISQDYPPDYGIWWCGLMVRSRNCPDFGHQWMTEMVRWTGQDQLAHSFLMHKFGMKPADLKLKSKMVSKVLKYLPPGSNEVHMYGYMYAIQYTHFLRYFHLDNSR